MSRKSNSIYYKKGTDGKDYWQVQPWESFIYGSVEVPEVANQLKVTIYESLFKSPAFQSLTRNEILMLGICNMQAHGKTKPKVGEYRLYGSEFCLSYGYLRKEYPEVFKYAKTVNDCKKGLITKGFIDVVSNGGKLGQRSIYKMSDRWKSYKPEKK